MLRRRCLLPSRIDVEAVAIAIAGFVESRVLKELQFEKTGSQIAGEDQEYGKWTNEAAKNLSPLN